MGLLSNVAAKAENLVKVAIEEIEGVALHVESIVVSLVATVVALVKRIVLVPVRLVKALLVSDEPVAPPVVSLPPTNDAQGNK